MIDYALVERFLVKKGSQEWVRKIWEQNLKKYGMGGTVYFSSEGEPSLVIWGMPKVEKVGKLFKRFRKKLHKAAKASKGDIIYVLKDGSKVFPGDVLTSDEYHKLMEFLKGE